MRQNTGGRAGRIESKKNHLDKADWRGEGGWIEGKKSLWWGRIQEEVREGYKVKKNHLDKADWRGEGGRIESKKESPTWRTTGKRMRRAESKINF